MKTITIDLHGMTAAEAMSALLKMLKSCPADTEEIEVIHGCHSGQTLLNMVRSFSHPKISRKILGLNNGMTAFVLKQQLK